MTRRQTLVVVGTMAGNPYAGMAWMTMQILIGLRRLGHDVYYFEFTMSSPYDPIERTKTRDSSYTLAYLARTLRAFGMEGRWAYRRSYSDGEWFGMSRSRAEALLLTAAATFNISGATRIGHEHLRAGRWIYYGTDPVVHELLHDQGDRHTSELISEHDDLVTYGENIGTAHSPIPPLPRLRARTRQPVLLDHWRSGPPSRREFTTVANWRQADLGIRFDGEEYLWSKHHEFLKIVDLPGRTEQPIELAMNLARGIPERANPKKRIRALGLDEDDDRLLETNGWQLADAPSFTTDPWQYRDYLIASRGEFSVARDLNVRLRSGWFSERSACYLAAGRPVVTQDTGFGTVLPTGEGLFAFNTMDDILGAFEAINSDYDRHSRAARSIAEEYFRAETVMAKLLDDLGV